MKKIIIDTDIGADSDDVVALAEAVNLMKKKELLLVGVTTSTARKNASMCVYSLLNSMGVDNVPIGTMSQPFLECDKVDNYIMNVIEDESIIETFENNNTLLARLINEKVSLVSIGPLTNIANLLRTNYNLFKENVEALYMMGGRFDQPYVEWNIEQNISDAIYVIENCPVKIVFSPYEEGEKILTGSETNNKKVLLALKAFNKAHETPPPYVRHSWDPLTVYACVRNDGIKMIKGTVSIDAKGVTTFIKGKGKHYVIKAEHKKVEKILNKLI